MSDDEYSSTMASRSGGGGGGGSDQHDGGHHKKGPRFSWTPAYEATFFRSLCEAVTLGLKDNHSFKQEAWDRAMRALQDRHGAYPNKGHLINKSDNARKKFRLWRGLREDPDFLYNPANKTVTATEEAWKAHVEKEPLSRSLKGRPFEHEEFYEILFPDVIGSGGAPKRVTKPRRKGPDALPGSESEHDTPGTAILNLSDRYLPPPPPPSAGQAQKPSGSGSAPRTSSTGAAAPPTPQQQQQQQQRPTQTAIPPRGSIASASALTPPEENAPHTRKRLAPEITTSSAGGSAPHHPHGSSSSSSSADKRRRTNNHTAAIAAATSNYIDLTHSAQQAAAVAAAAPANGIQMLADALKTAAQPQAPRWPEMAMDIFFRDFVDEDMDLQVKIAEKMLTDANKAVMFCKMPVVLRKHWVKRLREAHNRIGIGNER